MILQLIWLAVGESLPTVTVGWFPSLHSNRCKETNFWCLLGKIEKWQMATHLHVYVKAFRWKIVTIPVTSELALLARQRVLNDDAVPLAPLHHKRSSSGKSSSLLFCSWHVLVLVFLFFLFTYSIWFSVTFLILLQAYPLLLRPVLAFYQPFYHKNKVQHPGAEWDLSTHAVRAQRVNNRPSYRCRYSSSVWSSELCAVADMDQTWDMIAVQRGSAQRKWTGCNPYLQDSLALGKVK